MHRVRSIFVAAFLGLVGIAVSQSAARAQAAGGQKAHVLAKGTDILTEWSPGQHLYVKGNLGLDARRLAELEGWLDANGPNWTVLIMEHAFGEVYRDGDGRNHSGASAIEFALGQGLRAKTAIGDLKDERTGQGNAATLVILLKERKFFYSGSETHDRRGLGFQHWSGDLDRPAFRAMSNGRRIVDAVTGTVEEVGARLTRRLQAEQEERARRMREAQQRRDQAARIVGELAGKIDALEKELAQFSAQYPDADGDLASPKLPLLRDSLKAAQASLAAGAPEEALKIVIPVAEFVEAHRRLLVSYTAASDEFEKLNAEIGNIIPAREGWGAERLELARQELAMAQSSHKAGESAYQGHLESAREALRSAREEFRRAAEGLREEMARDAEQQRRDESRRANARRTAKIVAGLLGLAAIAIGFFLNRRRRTFKADGEKLIALWESGFEDKSDLLFALLDRTTVVVGSEIELPKRGYTGETLRLGKQTIEDVDQLFIMSSVVEGLLREARLQVYPKYGFQRLYNFFGGARYRKAMAKLRDELITFSPEDGVELLGREAMRDGKPETLLGRLESYQPFALSFPSLMDEFDRRAARATAALNLIDESWATISNRLEEARQRANVAGDFESEIAAEAAGDRLLQLRQVFEKLLPSGQEDLDAAVAQGATDPVGALAGPLPLAQRKADEAVSLCELVLETRSVRFPALRDEMRKLEAGGHNTSWVGRFIEEYSQCAEELAGDGATRSVAEDVAALANNFEKLAARCVRARELAARLAVTAGKQIGAVRDAASMAREEIGAGLNLAPDKILRERGLDPDVLLREADELQAAASLAIDRGGVDAAESALDEVAALMKEGLDLVAITRASFDGHEEDVAKRKKETLDLEAGLAEHAAILDLLKSGYEASALELSAGNPSHPTPGVSITDHVLKVERHLAEANDRLGEAVGAHREARLIEASSLLAHVGDLQHRVANLFGEIRERRERIEKMEQGNAHLLRQLDDEVAAMTPSIEEHRTMQATIKAFEEAGRDVSSARKRVDLRPGDPFAAGAQLAGAKASLEKIRNMAQSDRELFDELARSLQEGTSHLSKAKEVSRRASGDRIPDSRRIIELQEAIEKLILRQSHCERGLKQPHGDWLALDREADEIAAHGARVTAEMRGELGKAEAAVAAIAAAAVSVRDAGRWVGSYGVRIGGSPGANRLHQARGALMAGRYLKAHRYADDAGRAARQAIIEARNEEDRKRRAAARRAAEERRRSSSMFSSSSSSGSGFSFGGGGGGSGFGGSSGGSSMGSSSFSSSGSGMGSSGW